MGLLLSVYPLLSRREGKLCTELFANLAAFWSVLLQKCAVALTWVDAQMGMKPNCRSIVAWITRAKLAGPSR